MVRLGGLLLWFNTVKCLARVVITCSYTCTHIDKVSPRGAGGAAAARICRTDSPEAKCRPTLSTVGRIPQQDATRRLRGHPIDARRRTNSLAGKDGSTHGELSGWADRQQPLAHEPRPTCLAPTSYRRAILPTIGSPSNRSETYVISTPPSHHVRCRRLIAAYRGMEWWGSWNISPRSWGVADADRPAVRAIIRLWPGGRGGCVPRTGVCTRANAGVRA